ncbi:MAG: phosphohistidine phosphatase SixA [Candidatus Hydrothermales bacterium]
MEKLFFLVQHGEAKSEAEDPERHLTEKGKEESKKVAELLLKTNLKPDLIIHSEKVRAKETAEIFFKILNPQKGIIQGENLLPLDSPQFWAKKLKEEENNIMLVGHLPHLSKLTSLLIINDEDKEILKFRYSSCLILLREEKKFYIKLFITPEIAR